MEESSRPVLDEKAALHQERSDLEQRQSHKEVTGSDSNEAQLYSSDKDIPVGRHT